MAKGIRKIICFEMSIFKRIVGYIVFAVLCVLCAVAVSACGDDDGKIAVPRNLTVGSDMYLRWDSVSGAGMYVVEFDGIEYETETNSFDVLSLTAEPAKHTARVMAVYKNGKESDWSEEYTYEEKNVSVRYAFDFYYLDAPLEVGVCVKSKSVCSGKVFIPSTVKIGELEYKVTEIDKSGFEDCDNITSVVIPDTVTEIFSSAFEGCDALERVLLPNGLTTINSIFKNCERLNGVTIPESVVIISDGAFLNTGLTELRIPKNVKYLRNSCIGGKALAKLTVDEQNENFRSEGNCIMDMQRPLELKIGCNGSEIPKYIDTIGRHAFSCLGLTQFVVPSWIKHIDFMAFYYCEALESVVLSDGVEDLSYNSFLNCTKIKEINISKTVKNLEGAFYKHPSLEIINVDPDNPTYMSVDNCIIKKSESILALGCKTSVVPEYTKSIGSRAFYGCDIVGMKFPSGIETIEGLAFADTVVCEFVFPTELKSICGGAFNGSDLVNALLPLGVESIGAGAFANTGLRSVTIPDNVETIGIGAFENVAVYVSCDMASFPSGWVFMQSAAGATISVESSFNQSYVFLDCDIKYDSNGYPYVVSCIGGKDKIKFTNFSSFKDGKNWGAPVRNGYEYKGFAEQADGAVSLAAYTTGSGKLCALSSEQIDDLPTEGSPLYAVWSKK